jgi:nucleotide-binding universal stress UspA family protein
MLMPTRILVPTDFSEPSDKALEQALDIARQYHAKVFVVHVMHGEFYGLSEGFSSNLEALWKMKDYRQAEAEERLQHQLRKFPQANEVEVSASIRQGVAYEEILAEGKEKKIDLIVIASLGRTGIAKYLIGSVARNVLRGSKCPVLLTK